jgi:long-chain fatty acid transport protein
MHRFAMLVLFVCAAWVSSSGGGFEVQSVAARGAGMGGVLSMLSGSPTAAYVNPASMTTLRGTFFSIGTTVTLPNFRFTEQGSDGASTKMQSQALFPPNFCLMHTFDSGLGFGVTATIPYSSKTDWGVDWPGRRVISSSELRGIVVTPMFAFRATRAVSVGAGLNITAFRYTRSARVSAPPSQGSVEGTERMQGDGDAAYGFQAGVLVVPDQVFSFGFVYKSRSTVSFDEGSVEYDWPADLLPGSVVTTDKFSTSITLPDKVHAGMSIRPIEPLLLAGELEYVRWSSIDRVTLSVGDPATKLIDEQQGWKDVVTAHIGAEFQLGEVALRAGITLDRSPIPDAQMRPSIPDGTRTAYTAGIGYAIGEGLTLDVALQSVVYDDRTITNSAITSATGQPLNGTYMMNATVVGLNVSYSWK